MYKIILYIIQISIYKICDFKSNFIEICSMLKKIIPLLLIFNYSFSQEWLILNIISQNSKGIKYEVDNGEKISKKSTKDPSLVKLIEEFRQMGYNLNGVFPLFNNNANFNFQTTNLNLNNNLRTNLWFRKESKEE